MRASRSILLSQPQASVHLYWKCHNNEYLLNKGKAKELFFKSLIFGLLHRNTDKKVKLQSFCLMSNHVHQKMTYEGGSARLSHFMRVAHGMFGRLFNVANKRTGKVANERPKTALIGDDVDSQMRVHFYIEANPIRAGMMTLQTLRFYFWNSYRYYAYGEADQWTRNLTPPQWYLELGSTPQERQRLYRRLFIHYLESSDVPSSWFFRRFLGTALWIEEKERKLRELLRNIAIARQRAELVRAPPE